MFLRSLRGTPRLSRRSAAGTCRFVLAIQTHEIQKRAPAIACKHAPVAPSFDRADPSLSPVYPRKVASRCLVTDELEIVRRDEKRFRHFDEFLQTRAGAASQPFDGLAREYAASASSPAGHVERLKVERVLAKSLGRLNPGTVVVERDPMIVREALRRRCPPWSLQWKRSSICSALRSAFHHPRRHCGL